MKKETLIDFVKNNDFAYVYGAGIAFANDEESREDITSVIEQDGKMIEEVEDIENEGCGCGELSEEAANGCTIYKIWNYNQEPLYIAYYE